MNSQFEFFTQEALLARLTSALRKRQQEVVFLVGSPLSGATPSNAAGVPDVDGMIQLIRHEFAGDPEELKQLDSLITSSPATRYQVAFRFLQGRRGQSVANEIVRQAVLKACKSTSLSKQRGDDDEAWALLEANSDDWVIHPGTQALANLVTRNPEIFGKTLLTTNFDPLIEIAIAKAGGSQYKTVLASDGDLSSTTAQGCRVVHLHGFWHGSNTLHTPRQLKQPRPKLKASLSRLIQGRLVVVCGYGGWDDIFTATLVQLLEDDPSETQILWTFPSHQPDIASDLASYLGKGCDTGKIFLYEGIDCNTFLPQLDEQWPNRSLVNLPERAKRIAPVRFTRAILRSLAADAQSSSLLEGDDEDRPPVVELCLGRDLELESLRSTKARVVFITGIGGQGKSTVATHYFEESRRLASYDIFIWRDCKEESERFENQLASVIESLSKGAVQGVDLAKQDIHSLVSLLMSHLADKRALFVFDNIDHYVDLENTRVSANVELFVQAMNSTTETCRVVFTCRPNVVFSEENMAGIRLEGISLEAAADLFKRRNAGSTSWEIEEAHNLTIGHAFWLDLLAIQVAKRSPAITLKQMVDKLKSGQGELPFKTLQSVWATLAEREKTVLRAMAETVKPERENQIADYLQNELNFHKVFKALRALKSANLVVIKKLKSEQEVLELHPLVRSFIRTTFSRSDRISFIEGISRVYQRVIGQHRQQLGQRPAFVILQNWTQAAELYAAAENYQEAFQVLAEAINAFGSSAFPREFVRVGRILFTQSDWVAEHGIYERFDVVFSAQIKFLSNLGEYEEADLVLNRYAMTVLEKNARYIRYCDTRSYSYWLRRNFTEALSWAKMGNELKLSSGVDTEIEIGHTLALAERDSGNPDVALETFLYGNPLQTVIDPDELDEVRGGAFYGNIGRCLYLMGQIDGALACYQKSALLIEKERQREFLLNQGYIRLWVGEVLISYRQFARGLSFLEASRRKWDLVSPPNARRVADLQEQLRDHYTPELRNPANRVEKLFQDWIVGRDG